MLLAFLSWASASLSDADRERDTEGKRLSLWRHRRFTPLTHLARSGPEPCCGPSSVCLIAPEWKLMTGAMAQFGATITAAATEGEIAGRGAGVFLLHAVRPTGASCVTSGAQKQNEAFFFFVGLCGASTRPQVGYLLSAGARW